MSLLQRLERVKEADVEPSARRESVPPDAPVRLAPGEELAGPTEGEVTEQERYYSVKHGIFDDVLGNVDARLARGDNEGQLRAKLDELIGNACAEKGFVISRGERMALLDDFVSELISFGPLDSFLNDSTISRITVNSPKEISVDRLGKLEPAGKMFKDNQHLLRVIEKIAEAVGGRIDSSIPLLDRRLPDGSRIRAKVPPLAATGPTITIDKQAANPFLSMQARQEEERLDAQTTPYFELKDRVQERLIAELDQDAIATGQKDRLRQQIEDMINVTIAEQNLALSRAERTKLTLDLLNEIIGLGPIESLLADPEVSEIMVNRYNQIYVEKHGKLTLTDKRFRDNNHVLQIIEKIVNPLGRRIDEKSPMVDARLLDGSRVNAIIPPLALKGPSLTIRKFSKDPFTMNDLVNFGSVTNEVAQFLRAAVEARLNIVVSGGTGSGKTTMLNVLSSFIPSDERIVTVEDSAELQLRQDHVVTLEGRPPNIEGEGAVTIRDLVKNCLRMRPDRIVVGECRAGEALDMLQAMNTGHDGSLTTGHANNPREMLSRLEVMVLMAGMDLPLRAIREQIAGAVDLIVHMDRYRDGTRKVSYATEIVGMETDVITMQDLFVYEQTGIDDTGKIIGRLQSTGLRPKCYDQIIGAGIKLPLSIFKRG